MHSSARETNSSEWKGFGGTEKWSKSLFIAMQTLFFFSQILWLVRDERQKFPPSLNRVKELLLENHGFEFCRVGPILSEA